MNLGEETRVRYKTIKYFIDNNLVVENEHFTASHMSRSDDFPSSWRMHYDKGHHKYIEMNYIFFWRVKTSVMVDYYKDLIALRISYKRAKNTPMSNALKNVINSMYGTLPPRAQPAVTGMGRMFLHVGIRHLRDHFGDDTISIIYCDTDSVFFTFRKTAEEILHLSQHERDTNILKVDKHGLEAARGKYFTKAEDILRCASNREKMIYVSRETFNFIKDHFADYLNNRAHEYVLLNFETEKTFMPFLQKSRKKYIGFKANEEGSPLTNSGTSEKNSSKLAIHLMELLTESLSNTCDLRDTLQTMYHYIGKNVVLKMKDRTIDTNQLATRCSNSKINLQLLQKDPEKYKKQYKTKKFEMMIYRLVTRENRRYPFKTIREVCVYIDSLSEHETNYSQYPAGLVKKRGYQINIPKTMHILMSNFMAYIIPVIKPEFCHLFELLHIGEYDPKYVFKGNVEKGEGEPQFKQQSIETLCKLYKDPTKTKKLKSSKPKVSEPKKVCIKESGDLLKMWDILYDDSMSSSSSNKSKLSSSSSNSSSNGPKRRRIEVVPSVQSTLHSFLL